MLEVGFVMRYSLELLLRSFSVSTVRYLIVFLGLAFGQMVCKVLITLWYDFVFVTDSGSQGHGVSNLFM